MVNVTAINARSPNDNRGRAIKNTWANYINVDGSGGNHSPWGSTMNDKFYFTLFQLAQLGALEACEKNVIEQHLYTSVEMISVFTLSSAFVWASTPEGHDFWRNINEYIERELIKQGGKNGYEI